MNALWHLQETPASKKRAAEDPSGEAPEQQPSKRSKAAEGLQPVVTAAQPANETAVEIAVGAPSAAAEAAKASEPAEGDPELPTLQFLSCLQSLGMCTDVDIGTLHERTLRCAGTPMETTVTSQEGAASQALVPLADVAAAAPATAVSTAVAPPSVAQGVLLSLPAPMALGPVAAAGDLLSTAAALKQAAKDVPSEPWFVACRFWDRECAGHLEAEDLEDILLVVCSHISSERLPFCS